MQRFLIAATVLAAACASRAEPPSTPSAVVSQDDDDVTCQNEVPSGSLISHKACRSRIEREQDKQFARAMFLVPFARPCFSPVNSDYKAVDPKRRGERVLNPGGCL